MENLLELQKQFMLFLEVGMLDEAEQLIDQLMDSDLNRLATAWDLPRVAVLQVFSGCYNNIGMMHIAKSARTYEITEEIADMQEAARQAERCHEKSLDLFDISIEEIFYLPANYPLNKNFIFSLWGLGISSYFLERHAESRKYLQQCLRIPPEDEQAARWQSDASNYLHKIEKKPAQIRIKADTVIRHMFNRQLWNVRGSLLEWNSYAQPVLDEYTVRLNDRDANRLETLGIANLGALSGHILTLQTDDSCDLYRPLRLTEVAHEGLGFHIQVSK